MDTLTTPVPPGFLSPAAFPFQNGQYALPNEAPPTGVVPYLVTQGIISGTSLTMQVRVQTSPGDTIVVNVGLPFGVTSASCVDTRGNFYSLVNYSNLNYFAMQFVAQNVSQLSSGAGDTITLTTVGASGPITAIVIGVRSSTGNARAPWFTFDPSITTSSHNSTATVLANVVPAGCTLPAGDVVIGAFTTPEAVGPPLPNGQWTILGTIANQGTTGNSTIVAYRLITSMISANGVIGRVQVGNGNAVSQAIALTTETRIAPNQPAPLMPPGMQSPGAWQYAPLHAPEGPWSNDYNPGPNIWLVRLPAAAHGISSLFRVISKITRSSVVSHSSLVKNAGKALPAVFHTSGALAKRVSKNANAVVNSRSAFSRSRSVVLGAVTRSVAAVSSSRIVLPRIGVVFQATSARVKWAASSARGKWRSNSSRNQ